MIKRNTYIVVFVIGFVFGILSLVIGQPQNVALTFFFLTFVSLLLIKLVDEWRYFRSYNAPLASATFLVIPTLIGVGGSLLAHLASFGINDMLQTSLFDISLDLSFLNLGGVSIFWNLFGLIIVIPSMGALLILLRRYYIGQYPKFFINRRPFPNEAVIVHNFSLVIIFFLYWIEQGLIEFGGLLFCILSLGLFIQHYIMKIVLVPFKRVPRTRQTSSRTIRPRSSRDRRSISERRSPQPRLSSNTRSAASRTQNIRRDVRVAPGLQVQTAQQSMAKVTRTNLSKYVPMGRNISKDDFRCIFCYEFPIEDHKEVVICPHCRYPAHGNEFQKWIAVAGACSRCNKHLSSSSAIRVSGRQYAQIIKSYNKGR
ncbi:MAG: hypothetical protein ACFFE8_12660 [Candidatus Heimdallarchaeota archaeon]